MKQKMEGTLTRSVPFESRGIPEGENLVLEFPFASGEPYLRTSFWEDPWIEVLGMEEGECDLSRLETGAAVLCNHGRGDANSMLANVGITTGARLEGSRGVVSVKLSRRPGMEGLLQDIVDGIVKNVSVGYQIHERVLVRKNEEGPDEYRVTKWTPMEVSFVDIPADATVGLSREAEHRDYRVVGTIMEGSEMEATVESGQAEAEKARMMEKARIIEIRQAVGKSGLDMKLADDLVERDVPVDAAKSIILEKLAERSAVEIIQPTGDVRTITDETETRREMMTQALLRRYDPKSALDDGARQYMGLSLLELSRNCLEQSGIATRGMSRSLVAQRAFEGVSDFPEILANVANRTLRAAYQAAPRTFTAWARQVSAPDFKTISRVSLSDAPKLEKVNEHGEFRRGAIFDGKETYQLATVGKVIGITRQAIINDDLSAFTRIPALFAQAAANYESDTVYGILTANARLADNLALFHADHGNLASPGSAIDIESLGAARAMMRVQKTPQGVVMNLSPAFLIVPAALETIASQYVSQAYVAANSGAINPFAGALQVVSEGRLDAASAKAWYLAASSAMMDTVEFCYLEGQDGVYLETRQGFDVDGMEIKARLDFAAKAIDYRGLYKNLGA
ncbi:MAG: prohead protease/major capsid protein fusion protein [Burkholderiales bacterium]